MFIEFLVLFAPQIAAQIEGDSIEFIDKEVFSELMLGDENIVDILVKVKIAGTEQIILKGFIPLRTIITLFLLCTGMALRQPIEGQISQAKSNSPFVFEKADRAVSNRTETNVPVEIGFTAQCNHAKPFDEVILDVLFTDPAGQTRRVPAFWAGGIAWKVRYASPLPGIHRWRSVCNATDDPGLHNLEGRVEMRRYRGTNSLYKHGPVRIASDKRHFEYADGTPFFWLGDTWWMGLCYRLHFPDEFAQLTADRKAKGFNVVQIVAGLYPDMPPFDPRGANEAGFPWDADYACIRPEYFDMADRRLQHLVDQGITPCLVGAWGYFLPWMGQEKMQAHWRYLIARYSALPVIWCAAGEANLPWYLAPGFPYDDRKQASGWTEILRFIRATDPFRRPLTIHPTAISQYTARHATDDASLLDFDMLQTPHGQREAVPITVRAVRDSIAASPLMPIIDGEASYERLSDSLPTEWTRAMFWLCLMNGAKGHTYGANGIWQMNRKDQPHGASPHGGNYGKIAWDEAMILPGSQQMGYGKRFLESLPWTQLKLMPEAAAWETPSSETKMGSWIWFPEGDPKRDAPTEPRFFRRTFDVGEKSVLRRAALTLTADDGFTVWLNGKPLGTGANWSTLFVFDITAALRKGHNVLAVRAENSKAPVPLNPAGVTAMIELEFADGSRHLLPSDSRWRTAREADNGWHTLDFDDSEWSAALTTASYGDSPWGRPGAEDPLFAPQACGIADSLRVVYVIAARPIVVRGLRAQTDYSLTVFDPVTGRRSSMRTVSADAKGEWHGSSPAHGHDYVIVLTARTRGSFAPLPHRSGQGRAEPAAPAPLDQTAKAPFAAEIDAFEAADRKNPPQSGAVLFLGSSSIRLWTTLAADFPEMPVINRGFGGSQIADSVRYADRIVFPYTPKMIVLYAGGNDLNAGKSPAQVLKDFQEFVSRTHTALPSTRIVYLSINPSVARWKQEAETLETNRLIRRFIQNKTSKSLPLSFIDSHSRLLSAEEKPRPEILREDGLHLNVQGYTEWTAILKPQLMALWKADTKYRRRK